MDRLDDDSQALFAGRGDDAVLQFFAGPVGEGQAEYLRAFGGACFQDVGDPAGQDAGLAVPAGALSRIGCDRSLTTCCCWSFNSIIYPSVSVIFLHCNIVGAIRV